MNTDQLLRRLQNAEKAYQDAENSLSQSRGREQVLTAQLKKLCGTDDPEAAEQVLQTWKEELAGLESSIRKNLDEVEALING